MLKNLPSNFINDCNSRSITLREYIVLNNTQIPIKAKLKDDCYENGNFVGSFIFKQISFETENTYDFKEKEFEYYKVVNNESVKIGTFITTEVQDNDTNGTVKVVGMDYGLKTQIEYKSTLDYSSGTVTLLDVWNEACTLSGLVSGIQDFTNSDFIVDSDQFSGTGATIRDVFKGIAMSSCNFVKVMNDDKIYLKFTEQTDDIIEDYTDLEDKRDTHPITCVRLGMSQIEGENVDLKDDVLIEEYGENWLILNDNPFAYTQGKRTELITAIFNKAKGFGYSSFVSKTSFKPYLTCGDIIRFRNRSGNLVNSILLRYEHDYDKITLQAPSETSATVNYVYPVQAIDIAKRAEANVNKEKAEITLLTERTRGIESDLRENYYQKTSINEMITNSVDGVTNTFSEAGGNNIFRNTGLWFANSGSDSATNPYEYWTGIAVKRNDIKASNRSLIILQNGDFIQEQEVANGNYCVSFKYKKLIDASTVKVFINDVEYSLTETTDTEFELPVSVRSNHINVRFNSDADNSCEVYDLMVNAGSVKLAYSQNQNETTTDTVNISKGITIVSSDTNTTFKADSDGIRIFNNQDLSNPTSQFTDTGMETDTMLVEDNATVVDIKFQRVGNHTWMTKI